MLKIILTSLTLVSFNSLLAAEAVTTAPATKENVQVVKKALTNISFEDCCDEQYGDSDACHKMTNVTGKLKAEKGVKVKKECFADSIEDEDSQDF